MEDRKTVLIRTDGNPDIATGHLMRCLSIASALRELGGAGGVCPRGSGVRRPARFFFEKENFPCPCPAYGLSEAGRGASGPEAAAGKRRCRAEGRTLPLSSDRLLLCDAAVSGGAQEAPFRPLIWMDLRAFDCPADLVINYDFPAAPGFLFSGGQDAAGRAVHAPSQPVFRGLPRRFGSGWEAF